MRSLRQLRHAKDVGFEKSTYAMARPDVHRVVRSPGMMCYSKSHSFYGTALERPLY